MSRWVFMVVTVLAAALLTALPGGPASARDFPYFFADERCGVPDRVQFHEHVWKVYADVVDEAHLVADVDMVQHRVAWHNDEWRVANTQDPISSGRDGWWADLVVPMSAYVHGVVTVIAHTTDVSMAGMPEPRLTLSSAGLPDGPGCASMVSQRATDQTKGKGDTRLWAQIADGIDLRYAVAPFGQGWPMDVTAATPFPAPTAEWPQVRYVDLTPSEPLAVTVFKVSGSVVSTERFFMDGRTPLPAYPVLLRGGSVFTFPSRDGNGALAMDYYYRLEGLAEGTTFTPDPDLTGDLAGFRRLNTATELSPADPQGARKLIYRTVYKDGFRGFFVAPYDPAQRSRTYEFDFTPYCTKDLQPTFVDGPGLADTYAFPAKPGISWKLTDLWAPDTPMVEYPIGDPYVGQVLTFPPSVTSWRFDAIAEAPTSIAAGCTSSFTFTTTDVPGASAAPRFTLHPRNVTTIGTVTLRVSASGNPAVSYQWQAAAADGVWRDIPGARNPVYQVDSTTLRGTTKYRARATNAIGGTTSNTATVTVPSAPVFTAQPSDVLAGLDFPAYLFADAIGRPAPTLQWQSRVGAGPWVDIPGATSQYYDIENPTAAMHGRQFRARADNGQVTYSASATLVVHAPPEITAQPGDQTAPIGGAATFSVKAGGLGPLTYAWSRSTDSGATWSSVGTNSATLRTYQQGRGVAQYKVRVSNGFGSVTSTVATLGPSPQPSFVTQPSSVTVAAGVRAQFYASAWGEPAPTYQWQSSKDGLTWTDIPGATTTTLRVTAKVADTGMKFRLAATNTVAGVRTTTYSKAATLTVTG